MQFKRTFSVWFKNWSDGKKPDTRFSYRRPKTSGGLKRYGRIFEINTDQFTVVLNGAQINSIKKILEEAGEVKIVDTWKKQLS